MVWGWKVRSVPVFGSSGSSTKRVFLCFGIFLKERTVPVPFSVPGKRFRRFRFRFRFREKRFWRFRFPVLVRFLSHPAIALMDCFCNKFVSGGTWTGKVCFMVWLSLFVFFLSARKILFEVLRLIQTLTWGFTNPDPEVLLSGFGVNVLIWSGKFQQNCPWISHRILPADFSRDFFGLVSPGFCPPPPLQKFTPSPKIHAQNSSPISHFWAQMFFTPNFCLQGRPPNWRGNPSLFWLGRGG